MTAEQIEATIRRIVAQNAAARAEHSRLTALAIEDIRTGGNGLDDELASRLASDLERLLPHESEVDQLDGGDGQPSS